MNRRQFSATAIAFLAAPLWAKSATAKPFAPYRASEFTRRLATGNPLVVHVHADWCSVCRAQIPIMNRILSETPYRNVSAISVNFDKDKDFLTDFKIVRQSTIIVFRNGKEVARLSYDSDPQRIEQLLARAIS